MSRERLSKLQKWILLECATHGKISRNHVRRYFGKVFSPNGRHSQNQSGNISYYTDKTYSEEYKKEQVARREYEMYHLGSLDKKDYVFERGASCGYPKKSLCSTRSIEASASRSLTLLERNGLIEWRRVKEHDISWYGYRVYAYLTEKGKLKVNGVGPPYTVNDKKSKVNSVTRGASVNDKEVAHAEATRESVTVNSGATCPDVNLYSGEPVEVGA